LLQNILNILEHDEDTFHLIHDLNGDEIITYTYHSNLYVPRCTKVLNIFPVPSPDSCFQDVPVIIPRAEGGNFTAYLTKTGIIRKVSKIVTCKNVTIEINIRNRYVLTVNPHSVSITPFPKDCYEFNSHNNHFVQASYQHDAKLLEEIGFHNQPHNTISNSVDGRLFSSVDNIRESNPTNKLHWLNV
jgi:hypothetical protein